VTASPVVTPTPGTYPVPNQDATGSTNASVGNLPTAGVQQTTQRVTAPQPPAMTHLSAPAGFNGPGAPFGAVSADKRPY
jgi:hypothetical protein